MIRQNSSLCPSPILDQGRIHIFILIFLNSGAVHIDTAHIRPYYNK
ncbi:hypothetical protein CN326_12710 [Bacillus sp. AFS018417]|nr:hypothetical protein CN326_12710 [Bacillus sp. AFS018417]PHA03585.1 hypothetical protein COE51_00295 [Bacillus pseudomycoides]